MKALERIYAQIPAVRGCLKACSECCGPVPVLAAEVAQIASPVSLESTSFGALTPTKLCGTCAFSSASGCTIYASRPLICRLFGAVDHPRMTCPHGAKADKPLSHEQAQALIAKAEALA